MSSSNRIGGNLTPPPTPANRGKTRPKTRPPAQAVQQSQRASQTRESVGRSSRLNPRSDAGSQQASVAVAMNQLAISAEVAEIGEQQGTIRSQPACTWIGADPGPPRIVIPRNALEAFYVSVFDSDDENLRRLCPSDEELDSYLLDTTQCGEDGLEGARKSYHESANEQVHRAIQDGNPMSAVGVKPKTSKGVKFIDIPDSNNLAIRLWDGGLDRGGGWIFDFYSITDKRAVNAPSGWRIFVIPVPGTLGLVCGGYLTSWEENSFVEDISEGEERYSVPEGVKCALERDDKPLFYFSIPVRVDLDRPLGQEYVFASARDGED